jgi:hypothetical protein
MMRTDNNTGKALGFFASGKARFDSIPAFKPRSTKGKDMTLYEEWLVAKADEKKAMDERRAIEDKLVLSLGIPKTLDGTQNVEVDGFKVKIVGRLDRKVNSDKLQDLAAEHGLTEHLSSLFRWKPEINASAWKSADPRMTEPLLDAITSTNGRPSFTITKE